MARPRRSVRLTADVLEKEIVKARCFGYKEKAMAYQLLAAQIGLELNQENIADMYELFTELTAKTE
jgi:hypothetical protein